MKLLRNMIEDFIKNTMLSSAEKEKTPHWTFLWFYTEMWFQNLQFNLILNKNKGGVSNSFKPSFKRTDGVYN